MIKRILVALDVDSDTPVATQYAADIARRHEAQVVGLAVVDMGSIEAGARGGGIGSMYYAEKLRENLTAEARDKAHELLSRFNQLMQQEQVPHTTLVQEGVPFERIVEDMKYHDLLVVGKEPHFFYSRPEQTTQTLARVVRDTVAPTLIVGHTHQPVEQVLIAYDASQPSAHALRRFLQLKPFGTSPRLEIVTVQKEGDADGELLLQFARAYAEAHGFSVQTRTLTGGDPHRQIVAHANSTGVDLVVVGGHSVSKIKAFAFGSTTNALLKDSPVPLFLDH